MPNRHDLSTAAGILAVLAFLVILAVIPQAQPADAINAGLRSYVLYYNDMNGLTTINFAESTAAASLVHLSGKWRIHNPNAADGTSIVLMGGVGTTTGYTIKGGDPAFEGTAYRNSVTLYSSASTAVELYFESEE